MSVDLNEHGQIRLMEFLKWLWYEHKCDWKS
jgi:hypothetical protein